MKNRSFFLSFLLAGLFGVAGMLLSGCGDAADEEPALYTPGQIRRLLTADSSKVWTQYSEYYLGDSCRTGYKLLFSENEESEAAEPFFGYFYKDTAYCGSAANPRVRLLVYAPRLLPFQTTDSLVFFDTLAADTTFLYSRIKLLSSERLRLEFQEENGSVVEAIFQVEEEE